MKKKIILPIFAVFAILFLALGVFFTARAAFAEETITFDDGASIRIDTSEENNTSGIRFTANVPESLAEKEVGMIVVPAYILDGVSDNYADYFESRGVALSEISTVFTAAQKGSGKINGAIVGIRDENFNLEYQAVCYYKEGDSYVYSEKSAKRSIAFVADKGYVGVSGEGAEALKAEIIRIIGKSVEASIDSYMYEGQELDLSRQLGWLSEGGAILSAEGAVVANGSSLTATATGDGSVNISGYDGALSVTKTVKSVPVTEVSIKTQSWQQPENNMIQIEFNESAFSGGAYVDTASVVVEYGGKTVKVTNITEGNESKIHFYGKFPQTENAVFTFKAGSVFFKADAAYKITADRSFVWSGSQWWGYNEINWTTADWSPSSGVQVITTGMSDISEGNLTFNNFVATVNGNSYSGVSAYWYSGAGKLMFNGLDGAAANGLGTVLTIKAGSGFTEGRNAYRTTEDKSFVYTGKDGSCWMYLLGEVELDGVGYNSEKRIQIKNVDFAGFTKSNVQFQQYKGIYQNGEEITPNVWYHASPTNILDLGYHGGTGAETGGFSTDYPVEIKAGSVFYEDRNAYRISNDWTAEWLDGKWRKITRATVDYSEENKDWSDDDTLQIHLPPYGIGNESGVSANTNGFTVTDESGNAITGLTVIYYENVSGVEGNNKISISGLKAYTAQAITIKKGAKLVVEHNGKRLEITFASDVAFRFDSEAGKWNPITDSISSNGKFIVFTDLSPSVFSEEELNKYLAAGFTDFNLTFDAAELSDAVAEGRLVVTESLKNAISTLKDAGVKIYIRNQTDGGNFFDNISGEFNEPWAEGVSGFYFNDEPTAEEFSALTALVEFFNANYAATEKLFHINLFPSYADKTNFGVKWQGITSITTTYYSWEEYVRRYIDEVLTKVNGKKTLCVDCYPFGSSTKAFDKGVYIKDLLHIANVVKSLNDSGHSVTMGMCVQSFAENEEYNLPTSYKEISFQLLTGMAVGAELFEYFGYGNAIGGTWNIEGFAGNEAAYEAVKVANQKYLQLAKVLGAYEWQGLSFFAKSGNDALSKLGGETTLADNARGKLTSFSATENALCGYYSGEYGDGYMITNYSDPTIGAKCTVTLKLSGGAYVLVYGDSGEKVVKNIVNGAVTIEIEAGEGVFVAVRG